MRIFAKIRERGGKLSDFKEMNLFDRHREPLEWPSGSSSSSASSHNPSDTTVAPWTGPGSREIVVPWGNLTGDSSIAELTVDKHIKLLKAGQYLVNFEARFSVGFNGYSGSPPEIFDAGVLIGVYSASAGGPLLTSLARQSFGKNADYSTIRAFSVTAPVVVGNAPFEIVTAVYADVYPLNGNTVLQPQQGDRDWPRNPLQLQIIKL